jgi:starch synthase
MGHPIINENVRQAGLALAEASALASFHTGLDTTWLERAPFPALAREAKRRSLPEPLHNVTHSHPVGEIARLILERIPGLQNLAGSYGRFSIDGRSEAISHALSREVVRKDIDAVYAFEDSAHKAFLRARELGKQAFYDLPIGYWRAGAAIYAEEAILRPEWVNTLNALQDPPEKLWRKDQELSLATRILVASDFTARTLNKFQGELAPIHVIPYGSPPASRVDRAPASGPIRVIYVGRLTQRKGIADLLDAIPLVEEELELTIIGRRVGHAAPLEVALKTVRWLPSLPRDAVLSEIANHDVLVLPSLFEGFGMVLSEALSRGTPIIATDHTAAPDLLGASPDAGWVVPIRRPEAIAAAIRRLREPQFRDYTRQQALIASESQSWSVYRDAIRGALLS